MGGISVFHLIIVLVIVLLVFGPSRLGDLGESMGKAIRGFKKGMNEDPEIDVTGRQRLEQNKDGEKVDTKTREKDKV